MKSEARRYILQDAVFDWLTNYKKNSVKPSTYDRLKVSFLLFTHYPIAHLELTKVRCQDIQLYLNQILEDGYSMSSIKKQFNLLTAYFKHSFAQGDISSPVYVGAVLPRSENVKVATKHMEVYSAEEQRDLINVLMTLEHPSYGIALLMLEAGLRIGEVQALTWKDINWSRRSVTVSKTFVKLSMSGGNSFVQSSPKSKSSNRTIPLSSRALEMLTELSKHKRRVSEFIFPSDKDPNLPMSSATVRYYLRQACGRAGVEYKGNHIFRHTFATNCYYRGCNVKLLSKLLGHSDVTITYNTYIHLYGDALEEMRSVID